MVYTAFADDVVYFPSYVESSGAGKLHAVRATDGTLLWNFAPGRGIGIAAFTAADGMVYVGLRTGSEKLYAKSAADGTTLWEFDAGKGIQVVDGVVYSATNGGMLYALNAANGSVISCFDLGGTEFAVFGGLVLAYTDPGVLTAISLACPAQECPCAVLAL